MRKVAASSRFRHIGFDSRLLKVRKKASVFKKTPKPFLFFLKFIEKAFLAAVLRSFIGFVELHKQIFLLG